MAAVTRHDDSCNAEPAIGVKVLHILDHSLPLQSGYVFRTLGILKAQRAMGWLTVQMTTPKQGSVADSVEEADGWSFYRTGAPGGLLSSLPVLGYISQMRATRRRIERIVEEVRPDILHAHSPALNGVPAIATGRRLGIPVIYEMRASWEDAAVVHGTSKSRGLRYKASRALETYVLRRADRITTICEGLKGEIVGRGIDPGKVSVIPNAVDIETFELMEHCSTKLADELGLSGNLVFGFLGSFYAYEGLDLLLRAVPRVCEALGAVKILLVGGGPEEENLRALAKTLGIERQVVFTGRVPHTMVPRYYDLIDLFVYPRQSTRLTDLVTPLKPLEAMAKGGVVLASDVGGHRELIADGTTGYLFAADDVAALADSMCRLGRSRDAWPKTAAAARRFVERERTWKASVAGYRPVYQALMSLKRP